MNKRLRVLITGSTGKLMQVVAETLARENCELILNYRSNPALAKKIAQKIGAKKIVRADVTDRRQVAKMMEGVGLIDVLVNGVGNFIYKPLSATEAEEFADCVNSNLMSAWYVTHAVLPGMRRQKFGKIINFGSAGCDALTARPKTTPYYIGKTALLMLTRSLANEEKKHGITVNIISPGVLPHGVRPAGAPVVPYQDIAGAVARLIKPDNKKTGTNTTIARGWRPE